MNGWHAVIGYKFLDSKAFTELKPTSVKVLMYVSWLASRNNPCKVSLKRIEERCGMSRPTVIGALDDLEEHGAIKRQHSGRETGTYKICTYPTLGLGSKKIFKSGGEVVKNLNQEVVKNLNPLRHNSVRVSKTGTPLPPEGDVSEIESETYTPETESLETTSEPELKSEEAKQERVSETRATPTEPLTPLFSQKPAGKAKKAKSSTKFDAAKVELPAFVDRATWLDWVQYRRERKKPLTKTVVSRQIKQLTAFHKAGHGVNEIMNESIVKSWSGFFEPKGRKKKQRVDTAANKSAEDYGW